MNYKTLADGIEFISNELLSKWARRYTIMLSEANLTKSERNDIQFLVCEIGKEYQKRNHLNLA